MSETMVCHFDGPQPYASDTTGDPTGHLGQNATIVGSPTYVSGKYGKGLQTTASGDYIIYAQSDVNISVAAGGISIWVKPLGTSGVFFINGSGSSYLYLAVSGGEIVSRTGTSGSKVTSGAGITTNIWYHIALTWDGTNACVYLNGALIMTYAYSGLVIGSNVNVGYSSGSGLACTVDELIVCDHCPSAAAVRSYYADGELRIVGESESINLLDPDGFYLSQKGWRGQIAGPDGLGDYEDVIEALKFEWMNASDDDRAPTVQLLNRLLAEARRKDPKRNPNSFTPVYLEARGHGETERRYAVLREGKGDELPDRIWGPEGAVDLAAKLTREGAWRAVMPRANALPWPLVSAETIYNKQDGDGDNFVTIDGADVYGDAPALTVIFIDYTLASAALPFSTIIAKKSGVLADFSSMDPHFNATDEDGGAGTNGADTAAPADVKKTITGLGTYSLYWNIASGDSLDYHGLFAVYAVAQANNYSPLPTIQFGANGSYGGDVKDIPYLASAFETPPGPALVYGGVHSILPSYLKVLGAAGLTLNAEIIIGNASSTVTLYNLFIVPVDEPPFHFRIDTWTTSTIYLDGVWETAVSGPGEVAAHSPFIKLDPGRDNRLYFYCYHTHTDAGFVGPFSVFAPNNSMDVTITYVPRYLALRGAL